MVKAKQDKNFGKNFKNLVAFNDITIRLSLKNYAGGMTIRAYNRIIKELCLKYEITIEKKRFKSPVGTSWIDKRHIRIPRIKTLIDFMTALHEIGHIVNGHMEPKCVEEFHAELWALKTAKKLKIDIIPYLKQSMAYVLRNVAECHSNGRVDVDKLPREIKRFVKPIEPKLSSWKGYEVHVYDTALHVTIRKTKLMYYNDINQ